MSRSAHTNRISNGTIEKTNPNGINMTQQARLFVCLIGLCVFSSPWTSFAQTTRTTDRSQTGNSIPINDESKPPLPKAGKTWGEVLNPSGDVPASGFRAFYINTNNPRNAIASEDVNDIAINYSYNEFHQILSEDFGAYWIGTLQFSAPEVRMISVDQSWSRTRIVIDGAIAYEGGDNARVPFRFTEGTHRIEVEYVNNWHTTALKVAFLKNPVLLSAPQIRAELAARKLTGLDTYYSGLYESNAKDLTVTVNVAKLPRDGILFVTSYSAIQWIVAGPGARNIKAVVVASYAPGSEVVGLAPKVPIFQLAGYFGSYDFKPPSCSCVGGTYHCGSSTTLRSTMDKVEAMTAGTMVAYTGGYGLSNVNVPGTLINAETLKNDAALAQASELQRKRCEKSATPDFEHMMESGSGAE
jgi:hypothetical protein